MLVIKLDLEKNKMNYNAALAALSDFDVASAAWETDEPKVAPPAAKSGQTGSDLSSGLSAAIKFLADSQKNKQ